MKTHHSQYTAGQYIIILQSLVHKRVSYAPSLKTAEFCLIKYYFLKKKQVLKRQSRCN